MHKRILSMFLALVMLLSMVPFQALADGETEPETTAALIEEAEPETTEGTVAVETTAAVETTQATEETEAVETTVATEPVETTVETEPAETVMETVAETIEETTPETVAAQSVAITQEDELDVVSVGGELQLAALVLPEDASDKNVVWTSSNETVATVDETGLVTGVAMGEVTITAACGEVSATYDLTVVAAAATYELTGVGAEPMGLEDLAPATIQPVEETPDYLEVLAGKKLELEVEVLSDDENAVVAWSVPEEFSDYATVCADSKVSTKGILSVAPDISESHTITVRAALVNDAEVYYDFSVTLIPKTSKLSLRVDGEEIPSDGYFFDLNAEELAGGVTVSAIAEPKDAGEEVTWKVSDSKGLCSTTEIGGELVVVPSSGKTGSITVTATATDGTGKYAKATIRFIRAAASLEILNAPEEAMRSGTSVTLTTSVAKEPNLTDRNVVWSIVDGDEYATISASGKLTAKKVGDETQTITVRAEAKANPSAYDEKTITICPAITSIVVSRDDDAENAPVEFTEGTLQLKADVQPEAAAGSVKWVSSNTKVATVDAYGVVTFVNAGKVRISCEATDGTNKKGYFYLEVIKPVNALTISDPASFELIGGKSLNLKATTWTVAEEIEAANQKISWSIWEETDSLEYVKTSAATISSGGRVSAKSVKVNTEVIVVAKSAEDDEIDDEYTLTIMPSMQKNLLLYKDGELMGDTVTLCSGDDYQITAECYDRNVGEPDDVTEDCTLISSKPSVLEIDPSGRVYAKAGGSAVITARWIDSEGDQRMYTAKVTVKVANMVKEVEIAKPKNDYVRSGSSVSLKATAWTDITDGVKASNQKFTWKVFEKDDDGVLQETSVATISSGGRLTAKDVAEDTVVYAYAYSAEDEQSDSIELTIRPRNAYQLTLSFGDETGTVTVARNLTDGDLSNLIAELYVSDSADVEEDDYADIDAITWTTSNKKVVAIDEDGELVYPEGGITGKVTLTAKVTYNKKVATAKITLNVIDAVVDVEVSTRVEGQNLYSGKYLYLKADCLAGDDVLATNRKVVWSIVDGADYATIDAKTGKVTAKKVTSEQMVTVLATAVDDSCNASCTYTLTIYPMTTEVVITHSALEDGKLEVLLTDGEVELGYDTDSNCPDGVKWTSSRTSVASIDAEGKVTLKKRGTTTIRATAADGSGKSASITLIVK